MIRTHILVQGHRPMKELVCPHCGRENMMDHAGIGWRITAKYHLPGVRDLDRDSRVDAAYWRFACGNCGCEWLEVDDGAAESPTPTRYSPDHEAPPLAEISPVFQDVLQ